MKAGLWLLLGGFLGACALVYLQRRTGTLPSGAAAGTDDLLRRWEAGRVPPDQRAANFVLEDARGGRDPLQPPAPRSGMDGMLARARTALGIRGRAQAGPFAGELCREPGAIYKSYDDLLDRRDDRFIRSLANDILKAHEAGAKINIFAQGRAAEAALKAAKKLEGLPGGPKVRIDTLVTVGMSEDQLRELDPRFFGGFRRPANVREWSHIWADRKAAPPELAATHYSQPFNGGGAFDPGLSPKTYQRLLAGADEAGFDQAVRELGKRLAELVIRAKGLGGLLKPSREREAGFEQAVSARVLEPPKRVFRTLHGGLPSDRREPAGTGSARGSVGRSGGYDYAEAAAPDLASLQPGRDAGSGAREGPGKKAPGAVPARGGEPAAGKAFFVTRLIACAESPKCRGTLTEETPVLGYLRRISSSEYWLCASPNLKDKEGCVILMASLCSFPDGRYRVTGDFTRYDPPYGIVIARCDGFQRFDD